MFTIKWVVRTEHGAIERLYEAEEIIAAFRNGALPSSGSLPQELPRWEVAERPVDQALFIMDPYGAAGDRFAGRSFDVGTVYVMNESGSTVGKFVLSDEIVKDTKPLHIAA